jgi:5-methylthioadenosine/S-adenosylhomocysteine deaminase
VPQRIIFKNCAVFRLDGRIRQGLAVVVEGEKVVAIDLDANVPVLPGDWQINCRGRLVGPGFFDCHARLVSGPLSLFASEGAKRPFLARLHDELNLSLSITPAEIEVLSAQALASALRRGVTCVVEQLLAPQCVAQALLTQIRVSRAMGMRLVVSHGTQSFLDTTSLQAQIEANAQVASDTKSDGLVRANLGVLSASTASDAVLREVGALKESAGLSCHFRLDEGDDDVKLHFEQFGASAVSRFERFGLLGAGSIAAHGRSLSRGDASRLAKSRTLLVLCSRSAQWATGARSIGLESVLVPDNLVGLGSDGTGSLSDEAAVEMSSLLSLSRGGSVLVPDEMLASYALGGPAETLSTLFGKRFGVVDVGACADLVLFDWVPPSLGEEPMADMVYQLFSKQVAWSMVNGRVLMREGVLLGCDTVQLAIDAAKATAAIRKRVTS